MPGRLPRHLADVLLPEPEHDAGAMAPAGQLWTSVEDLSRWAAFAGGDTADVLDFTSPLARLRGYRAAVEALRAGELVGVFPEATISQSFDLKEFKSGAARMASEAGVPLLPVVVWGSQRVWTKGHPKRLGRTNVPILINVGEPIPVAPDADPDAVTHQYKAVMTDLLAVASGAEMPRNCGSSSPKIIEKIVASSSARALDTASTAPAESPSPASGPDTMAPMDGCAR